MSSGSAGNAQGADARITGESLPAHAEVSNSAVKPPAGLPALSRTVELRPSGPLKSPATVDLTLTAPAPRGEAVVVATSESAAGPWTYLSAKLAADRRSVRFITTHFSFFSALGIDVDAAFAAFKVDFNGFDSGATMTVDKPTCTGEDSALSGGYAIRSSSTDAVYKCFGMRGANRVLTITDNRRYPMEVAHPNLSVAVPGSIDWAQLSSLSHLGSGNFTIIAPGDSVTYQVNVPSLGVGGIETQSDGVGQSLYALQTGVTTLIDILTRFGAGSGSNAVNAFSTLLGITSCADAMGKDLGTIVSGCLSPDDLVKAFGTKALLIAPVMALGGLVAFFHSEANVIVDVLNNHDDYKILISRDAPSAPTTTTTAPGTPAFNGNLLSLAFYDPSDNNLTAISPNANPDGSGLSHYSLSSSCQILLVSSGTVTSWNTAAPMDLQNYLAEAGAYAANALGSWFYVGVDNNGLVTSVTQAPPGVHG